MILFWGALLSGRAWKYKTPPIEERRPMTFFEKDALLGIDPPPPISRSELKPRWIPPKPKHTEFQESWRRDLIVVKFVEGSGVRLREGKLTSLTGSDLSDVMRLLEKWPKITVMKVFPRPEEDLDADREYGERKSGLELADLNLYFKFIIPENEDVVLAEEIVDSLNALGIVEIAYPEPIPQPAQCSDIPPTTPNWWAYQDYMEAAPVGINAYYGWLYHPDGPGVPSYWFIDVEWNWTTDHEDLNAPTILNPPGSGNKDHGTAVLGEVVGCSDGFGITGIAYGITAHMINWANTGDPWPIAAAAYNLAASYLFPGEIFLIEQHAQGPSSGEDCQCNCDQFEYIPMEYWDANFNAILNATAAGINCVEAGGNGSMNLDNPIYGNKFNRSYRDSRAILVGAGTSGGHSPECWTNYGSRIDVQGYGDGIYTTGYGSLFNGGGDERQYYTAGFSGTSGASPINVGVVAILENVANQKYGVDLDPLNIREVMTNNGTPQGAPYDKHIGVLPDLVECINAIEPNLTHYLPSGWSYPLVPRNTTGTNGSFCPLPSTLNGNDTSYLNMAGVNNGITPTDSGFYHHFGLDGVYVYWGYWGPVNSNQGFYHPDAPVWVKGGRHTLSDSIDPNFDIEESNEDDNLYYRQFVWEPYTLIGQWPVGRTAPPLRTLYSLPYMNCDGFDFDVDPSGSEGWWGAIGVIPVYQNDDYDMVLYDDYIGSENGFDTYYEYSGWVAPYSDFVIVNRNQGGNTTNYAGVVRWAGGVDSFIVEFVKSPSYLVPDPGGSSYGSYYISLYSVLDIYEVWFSEAGTWRVIVDITSGNPNLGVAVYSKDSLYMSKSDYMEMANSNGAGESETLDVYIPDPGFYGLVVFKNDNNDINVNGYYYLHFRMPNPNITYATPSGWDYPIVPRNTGDASGNNVHLPTELIGNENTTYLNWSAVNNGLNDAPGFMTHLHRDGTYVAWGYAGGGLGAGDTAKWLNIGTITVKGGRHTLSDSFDIDSEVVEEDENDNYYFHQFIWSPFVMSKEVPVYRTPPPPQGPGPYPNCDGFEFTRTGNVAYGSAVASLDASDDYDLILYLDYTGPEDGFSIMANHSYYVSGYTDFIVATRSGTQATTYPAVTRFSGGSGNFYIDASDAVGRNYSTYPVNVTGELLDQRRLLTVYEFYLTQDSSYDFYLQNVSGNANLSFILYGPDNGYYRRGEGLVFGESGGPGDDESFNYTPNQSGWYILAVFKNGSYDVMISATYNLTVEYSTAFTCGDVNCNGVIGFDDLNYLGAYLYFSGPPPCSMWAADVNCSGVVGFDDLNYIGAYLYFSGPDPNCCPTDLVPTIEGEREQTK